MNIFYQIFIYPIVQIIKVVYVLLFKIFQNPGISVLGVSCAVTLLCLPLYVIAEKWQQIERETIKKLKPGMDKIKAVFTGDERYMILATYYRQRHYHPVYALRGSLGLLIQIPFFIAAYSYLSNLNALKGASFLFIGDLGSPDFLFSAGNFTVNVLPLAMTAINCLAGFIYTKDLFIRDKIQIYGLALVFLVLLYNSPAGLVLYWTMNNILSLFKNVFYRIKNPLRKLYAVFLIFAVVFFFYILLIHDGSWKRKLFFCLFSLAVICIPLLSRAVNRVIKIFQNPLSDFGQRTFLFIICAFGLAMLAGMAIPSMIIGSSPQEFSFIDSFESPLWFLAISFCQALGIFLCWPLCVYFLFKNRIQTTLALCSFLALVISFINVFVFSGDYGNISNSFLFDTPGALAVKPRENLVNIIVILAAAGASLCILKKAALKTASVFAAVLAFALVLFSLGNTALIQKKYAEFSKIRENGGGDAHALTAVFSLSKEKPNVIVFMIDAAVSGFLEPVFAEHPRLKTQFDGFTFYPNTVSFASHTLMAVPVVWGGYEYTPFEMNRRSDIPLVDKHNEALFLLPTLFSKAGYSVTVSDPSWANYSLTSDITIYRGYSGIQAVNLIGKYRYLWNTRNNFNENASQSQQIINNAIWFSFLKMSPFFVRGELYDEGSYWNGEAYTRISQFLDSFSELDLLPELTACDSEKPAALFITNETTHNRVFLQYPDYRPAAVVTDKGPGPFSNYENYHSNNAFYLGFGRWLDALKQNGVYDNTRIIVVSDHGASVDAKLPGGGIPVSSERLEKYNPLLLVKDFNSHGELVVDHNFMTNADVPALAMDGIMENPVNPFTGRALSARPKAEGVYITDNHLSMAHNHDKNVFKIINNQWIYVRDNIFERGNWARRSPFDNQPGY